MLSSLTGAAGKTAGLTISQGSTSGLTDAEKAAVGNHPLIQLTLTLDGVQTAWNNPAAPVTVTIPYTPTAAELNDPECLIIWYLDGSGNPVCIPNGHYDAATGTVTFTTSHFSFYAGGFNVVRFNDVAADAWYGTAVDFIAARGITTGTGGGKYSPDAKLTRAEFLVMLMRSYGIAPDANPSDNFADAGNTWYTHYLAAAKRRHLGGIGKKSSLRSRNQRQEMFTRFIQRSEGYRGLQRHGGRRPELPDADKIAPWAKTAIEFLSKMGVSRAATACCPLGYSRKSGNGPDAVQLLVDK
jgi:hypothetical protein